MPDNEKPEPKASKKAATRSVLDWAKALGHYRHPGPHQEGSGYDAAHAAADALHGWSSHAHHAGEPMQLTEDDYRDALAAAMPKEGNPKAHRPALSKHCPHDAGWPEGEAKPETKPGKKD